MLIVRSFRSSNDCPVQHLSVSSWHLPLEPIPGRWANGRDNHASVTLKRLIKVVLRKEEGFDIGIEDVRKCRIVVHFSANLCFQNEKERGEIDNSGNADAQEMNGHRGRHFEWRLSHM